MPLDLLSVMHVNVNCSDLDRSLQFYRDIVGLTAMTHTKPAPQAGEGFGLSGQVQWDAHLLHDHRGMASPALDLLEWQTPAPVGAPPADLTTLGFSRLGFRVPDLDAKRAEVAAAGADVTSVPGEGQRFCVVDPDGTRLEFVEAPGPAQLMQVTINCSSLDRSASFYREVLGLEVVSSIPPSPPDYDHARHAIPGQSGHFCVDLVQWKQPAPHGHPPLEANHLGMFRMAFMVSDAAAGVDFLRAHQVETSDAVWLDMGPDIPIDGLWAVFFKDPDGACLELIETPR